MIVKVCGMNDIDNLNAIAAYQPDYFGFIFYSKSKRNCTLGEIPEFSNTKKIGVFVDDSVDFIISRLLKYNLDGVQLHGNESPEYIKKLKSKLRLDIEIIKAISIVDAKDFEHLNIYHGLVDKIILDTKTPLKGGSGKQFNWDLLKHYNAETPYLLSGGISLKDAEKIAKLNKEYDKMLGVDINSRFELKPGLKSLEMVKKFILKIKK
jgi:phosphoribosylanthranilate isomerase